MVTVFRNKHLGWANSAKTISLNHYEIIVDNTNELPNNMYYFSPDHKMSQGSIAWVISESEFYMMNSQGTWILQNSTSNSVDDNP